MPTRSNTLVLRLPARATAGVVAAALALCLVGAGVAGGLRMARPTAVAVVDLSKVIEGLDQRAAMVADIEARESAFAAEGEQLADAVKADVERFQALAAQREAGTLDAAGEAELSRLADEIARRELSFNAWEQRANRILDRERGLALQQMFTTIGDEASALAEAAGYDIVVVDDSSAQLVVNARRGNLQEQIAAQLRSRRVIYANRQVDITQDLVDRMNNAYNAGG